MKCYLMTPALGLVSKRGNMYILTYVDHPKAEIFEDIKEAKKVGRRVLILNGLKVMGIYDDETNKQIDLIDLRQPLSNGPSKT